MKRDEIVMHSERDIELAQDVLATQWLLGHISEERHRVELMRLKDAQVLFASFHLLENKQGDWEPIIARKEGDTFEPFRWHWPIRVHVPQTKTHSPVRARAYDMFQELKAQDWHTPLPGDTDD